MFDIKASIKESLELVDEFRSQVEQGNCGGFMILHFPQGLKEPSVYYSHGEINCFEWIGLLEFAKDILLEEIAGED